MTSIEEQVRDHAEILAALESLPATVEQLSEQLAALQVDSALGKTDKVPPWPNVKWHDLTDEELKAELHRIAGWLKDVGPVLGVKEIPRCALQHLPAVVLLDAAMEYWRPLWLSPDRTMSMAAAQCDYLTRIWPAIKDQVSQVIGYCGEHSGLYPVGVA